jgi:hypothetical protein
MTFLSPLFLAGMTAAAVPIVLHLLKREPEPRVKFAVVSLLKRAPVEDTEKHRLRELLLLALRVAALVLLALAFARPFIASGAAAGPAGMTIVALDTSYSMSAPGRFERARQLARDAIARAPSGDRVGLVAFSDDASIVAQPTSDRVLVTSAVDQVAPGFGATRYRAALSAAGQALAGLSDSSRSRGTIVVVTDLQETGWDVGDRVSIPEGARVEIADVGPVPPNLAVTAVRSAADRLVATIRNAGPRPREARVHLTVDGRAAGETTAALAPNESADVTFVAPVRGAAAAVSVDDPEGLPADNVRYLVLSASNRPSVLVVGGSGDAARDAFYVQHALAVGQGGGYEVTGASGVELSAGGGASGIDDRLASQAAVVLVSTRGLERRGREALAGYVQSGGGLLVAAGPDVDGAVAADVLGASSALEIVAHESKDSGARQVRTLAPADVRHPVFRPFAGGSGTLTLVRFRNAARISGAGCQTLARFTSGDRALLECGAGEGRALVFASDLDNRWNDFPLHASFVPFLHEAVRYLSSTRAHTFEYLVADAPRGVPREPGVHVVNGARRSGPDSRVAVNVDPRETEPTRLTVDEFQGAVTHLDGAVPSAARAEARQQEDNQHLWQYALALMIAALAVEGLVASRTA